MKRQLLIIIGCSFGWMLGAQTPVDVWTQQVDQAALSIKDNPQAAEKAFDELLKGKNKKNTALLVDIGEAYLKEGKYDIADVYAQRAKDVDSKYAEAYLLSGDVAWAKKDVNKASSDYNQAIFLDDDCCEAYFKYARLYQGVNPQLSIEVLEKLQKKLPGDSRVHKQLGDVYYSMGEYGKAIVAYDEFMDDGTPAASDYARYGMLLYLNKEYDQSLQEVEKGLTLASDNLLLKRLSMYNHYELGDYDDCQKAAVLLLGNPEHPDLVYLDFVYYGNLLSARKKYADAITQYEKALSMDSRHPDIYQDMSEAYEKMNDYPNAIIAFKKYMETDKSPSDIGDLFLYGRLNYYAAADTTCTNHPTYLEQADKAFAEVAEYAPDNYLGSFWRARTRSLLDPETTMGLAKPHYETALTLLEQKPESSKDLLIECLSYLGYYYFVQEDYPQSKTYWTRILTLDPENETALKALEGLQ